MNEIVERDESSCSILCLWTRVLQTIDNLLTLITGNSSVAELGERYRPNHAVVVKHYQPYTQFPERKGKVT